jgi:predicted enzyme related to lactoylglutathione lyase
MRVVTDRVCRETNELCSGAWRFNDNALPNTLGIRRIMFAVEGIDDVVARLRAHGADLVGELVQYENSYRLCYVRGPEGILVALAEKIG